MSNKTTNQKLHRGSSGGVRRVPAWIRAINFMLVLSLLPYGIAQAELAQDDVVACETSNRSESNHAAMNASLVVLSRLGIEASMSDAQQIEEAILSGADPSEISRDLPGAFPSTEQLENRTLSLLNQIPLAARAELLKELAQGSPWESIAPEILAQVPLALAVTVSQENPLSVACSIPTQTLGVEDDCLQNKLYPTVPLPIPYGESSPAQQTQSANVSGAAMIGALRNPQEHKLGFVERSGHTGMGNHALGITQERESAKVQTIYYFATMMPTGPPSGNTRSTNYLPTQYHFLLNAALSPTSRSLKTLLDQASSCKSKCKGKSKPVSKSTKRRIRNRQVLVLRVPPANCVGELS